MGEGDPDNHPMPRAGRSSNLHTQDLRIYLLPCQLTPGPICDADWRRRGGRAAEGVGLTPGWRWRWKEGKKRSKIR